MPKSFKTARTRREFLGVTLRASALCLAAVSGLKAAQETAPAPPRDRSPDLREFLSKFKKESNVPAIAVGVMKHGVLVAGSCVGVRKLGAPAEVTMLDQFRLGSCTKAMTATVAAGLVDRGVIRWTSTLAQIFPERVNQMYPSYRKVSLELLLTHRAGAPRDSHHYQGRMIPIVSRRLLYLDSVINFAAESDPDTRFSYSNAGYIMAGAMLERVTGRSWEDLMRSDLFGPLGMNSAGFGPPATPDSTDQPWGHKFVRDHYEPTVPDDGPVRGPCGGVHSSIGDWLKFADLHVGSGQRSRLRLSPASFAKLHTPRQMDAKGEPGPDGYALGWFVKRPEWAKGPALTHAGSNGDFLSVLWVMPGLGLCVAAVCNAYKGKANVVHQVASELLKQYS